MDLPKTLAERLYAAYTPRNTPPGVTLSIALAKFPQCFGSCSPSAETTFSENRVSEQLPIH